MPPINPEVRPSHERARITDQENRSAAVLVRVAELAEHVLLGPLGAAFRVLLKELLDHGRHDVARAQRVDADAVLAPFRRQIARELDHAGFGGVVGGAD